MQVSLTEMAEREVETEEESGLMERVVGTENEMIEKGVGVVAENGTGEGIGTGIMVMTEIEIMGGTGTGTETGIGIGTETGTAIEYLVSCKLTSIVLIVLLKKKNKKDGG